MKTLEIIGYPREDLGKKEAKKLRKAANAPGVLYGGASQMHFYAPMMLLSKLLYTPDAHFVNLTISGTTYVCILQDVQFHPVSEMILHIDFLQIFDDKQVKMQIPTVFVGKAPGVIHGGNLTKKLRKLPILAYPKDMPSHIPLDVSNLELGQITRVRDIKTANYTVLVAPNIPVASVEIPRALRSSTNKAEAAAAAST